MVLWIFYLQLHKSIEYILKSTLRYQMKNVLIDHLALLFIFLVLIDVFDLLLHLLLKHDKIPSFEDHLVHRRIRQILNGVIQTDILTPVGRVWLLILIFWFFLTIGRSSLYWF